MVSVRFYRQEAERFRKLARDTENVRLADQYRKSAREYEALADELDTMPSPSPVTPMQQQPVQQQQTKIEPDDKQ